MNTIMWILSSTLLVSVIAFLGIFSLIIKRRLLDRILLVLVALSAGGLMGGAFLHLIPESMEKFDALDVSIYVLAGFALFFLIERLLHWRHCHEGKCQVHRFAYMNLYGDAIHNLIDGMIIAASFVTSIPLGITTTLAVALHEIPQEIGDFGVLVYGGFERLRALLLNFGIALTAILGGLIGYFMFNYVEYLIMILLPLAAGGFIYIAASDLIPELHKEGDIRKSILYFVFFLIGLVLMYAARFAG